MRKLRSVIESALTALEGKGGGPSREDVVDLLASMRKELIEAKAVIPKLEEQLETLRKRHEHEIRQAEDCHRRALQAQSIGDDETVEVALRFEAKHRVAADVFVQKIEAAEAELLMQRQDVADMTEQFKSALNRRDALAIQARRSGTTGRMRGESGSAVDEFDRLVDELEREEGVGDARRALDLELNDAVRPREGAGAAGESTPTGDPSLSHDELAELQLAELKRRMGRESKGDE